MDANSEPNFLRPIDVHRLLARSAECHVAGGGGAPAAGPLVPHPAARSDCEFGAEPGAADHNSSVPSRRQVAAPSGKIKMVDSNGDKSEC